MSGKNTRRDLIFADRHMSAVLIENVENCEVDGIVVNLSPEIIEVEGKVNAPIFPWRSTIVRNKQVISARRIAVLKITEIENLGGVMFRGWQWFGEQFAGFPRETPLYVSKIDSVGTVQEDPFAFTREKPVAEPSRRQEFEIRLKCWWSPCETDCFIHTEHPFLEVHTQIHGEGRMQKFRENDASTIYEDVVMMPGFTHEPFCRVTGANEWTYPWHRYYTVREGIWLAIELHPLG
ncbi:hypothetical protein [Nitratireductor sp. ZSWI3]|uniref:hypothetical protein n=1 Tax=Nitratireductor sp. ZSWI3 TaxID=2966359 RepID=UPI00214FA7AD|nr:hypothetical protein [Nitratireductor sp. ZSWI3]MCR4265835.1 hypothetical protein [Nitratireductor sp. ZSWI3]